MQQTPKPLYLTPNKKTIYGSSDAGADTKTARIGGWYTDNKHAPKDTVYWFAEELDKTLHPWAFEAAAANHRIAAQELFATTKLLQLANKEYQNCNSQLTLPLRTDNQGNDYNIFNYKAKKWPNSAILMELTSTVYIQQNTLSIGHVHRELNTWADQLTKNDTTGFHPLLRRRFTNIKDYILPTLLQLHYNTNNNNTK